MKKINKSTIRISALLVLAVLSVNVYALSGSGTEADPFQIMTKEDVTAFYDARSHYGKHFILS